MTKEELIEESATKAAMYVNTNFPNQNKKQQIDLCKCFLAGYIECAKNNVVIEGHIKKDEL